MRAIWSGEIAFGLVAIPVKLYSATRDLAPHFHYIHKKCGTRIETVRRCPHCEVDVAWEDIDKGYEVSKGHYAKFTKEEIEKLGDDTEASGIDIAEFVDSSSVDLALIEKSYWVGPAGKTTRGYELLRAALEKTGKAAIAKVKLRTRTRLGLLRPREGRFSLDVMRFGDELVDGGEIEVPKAKVASPRELQLALGLIDQLTTTFDPERHPDDYRTAVAKAVAKKVEADEVTEDAGPSSSGRGHGEGKVLDLAEMLSRSLAGAKGGAQKPTKKHAPAAAAKRAHASSHAKSQAKTQAKSSRKAAGKKATVHHLPRHKKAS